MKDKNNLILRMRMQNQAVSVTQKSVEPEIMVSVLAPAYNHEAWIARTLESFVAQQTTFPIEILVHDDASTDRTAEIIRDYEKKYPGLVKGVYQTENQYSQGRRASLILAEMASGKYLAICECDDYWTDPFKLQKQVELLEAHPECSMCVAQSDVYKLENGQFNYQQTFRGVDKDLIFIEELCNGAHMHTSTYVIPKKIFQNAAKYWHKIRLSDTALCYVLIDTGPFVFLREIVSIYQITGEGVYTSLNQYERGSASIRLFESLYKYFNSKYRKYYVRFLVWDYMTLIIIDLKERRFRHVPQNAIRLVLLGVRYAPVQTLRMLVGRLLRYIRKGSR